jgi:hypothetical protein
LVADEAPERPAAEKRVGSLSENFRPRAQKRRREGTIREKGLT